MNLSETEDLSGRLEAVVADARGRVKAFQEEAEAVRQGIRERFGE